jgi:nucleoside diphosphate kinase
MCLALAKENAISLWRDIVGPASSIHAKEVAPNSIRALYGTDSRINAVFGADSQEMAARLKSLLLDSSIPELPMNDFSKSFGLQKTLVIIKPNMVPDKVDEIIDRILCKGFQVAKREQIELKPELIAQLYPKMKDQQKIDFMTSGPVVALAVTGEGAIEELKEMFGPNDPKEALEKYPMSLRAQFGTDRIKNVVHTSTTIEDATHEIELLFPFSLRKNGSSIFQNRTRPTSASNNEARASQLQLHAQIERTVAIIKPDGMKRKSEIIEIIDKNGFKIVKQYENRISLKMAQDLYKEHIDKPFYEELTTWLSRYLVLI